MGHTSIIEDDMGAVLQRNWLVVAWFILAVFLTIIIHVTADAAQQKYLAPSGLSKEMP